MTGELGDSQSGVAARYTICWLHVQVIGRTVSRLDRGLYDTNESLAHRAGPLFLAGVASRVCGLRWRRNDVPASDHDSEPYRDVESYCYRRQAI